MDQYEMLKGIDLRLKLVYRFHKIHSEKKKKIITILDKCQSVHHVEIIKFRQIDE
jgi:hypothetical protein